MTTGWWKKNQKQNMMRRKTELILKVWIYIYILHLNIYECVSVQYIYIKIHICTHTHRHVILNISTVKK